jgi:soluble lytic murein transglycosylase
MPIIVYLFLSMLFSLSCSKLYASELYLQRFNRYLNWSQQLPSTPTSDFLEFIHEDKPLSIKLREKWLYELAQRNDWHTYLSHYQTSSDLSLQCYAQFALYQEGDKQKAAQNAKKLWLTGESRPPACDKLFTLMLNDNMFDHDLVETRVKLALAERNFSLATYLLKKNEPKLALELDTIQQSPKHIQQLKPGYLNAEFYLYGLKRLLFQNVDNANQLWQQAKARGLLNEAQQQEFIAQIALYKSVKNKKDADHWLARIKQEFMSESLLEWRIRFALKKYQWAEVERLIHQSKNQDTPIWQYWLARSKEARGQHSEATEIYKKLAPCRHYYGFLSSLRLHQPLQFSHEEPHINMQALSIYKPVTEQLRTLYVNKQTLAASRLANDFSSELPKDEKSAFIYWLAHDLGWVGKSVYLSNDEALNNQLILRFPLAYRNEIKQQSQRYQVPEALIYAIIRQESAFRDDVVSYAGAHGLMQLMPKTASWISKMHHISYQNKQQLFGLRKNIHLGVAYLSHLSKNYQKQLLLTVAAYNAGPTQVRSWLNAYPLKEADIWIEVIPFNETRNYIKSVMSYYAVYQFELKEKPNLEAFIKTP